jgi:hypothetical protein
MMSSSEATGETSGSLQNIPATYARIKRQYQQLLDRVTPHVFYRWIGTTLTVALFELRILYAQGVRVHCTILEVPHLQYFLLLPGGAQWYIGMSASSLLDKIVDHDNYF